MLLSCFAEAVKAQVAIHHPDSEDLSFLYGTILTDGQDEYSDTPTANLCVFAEKEVCWEENLRVDASW